MQFELDADEQQLQDSLRRLLDAQASFERRRLAVASQEGWHPALWQALGELGVTAMVLPEAHGGFGQATIAWLPVLQELGRALALSPFLATAVLAATAIARGGSHAQQGAWLPAIASAQQVLALAHDEPAARHAPLWVEAEAARSGDGWRITGPKRNVLHGASADLLVVSARTGGAPEQREGVALFLVDAMQAGVQRTPVRLIDDTPAAEIRFDGALAEPLAGGWRVLEAVQQAGLAAVCAEALGVAERAYALTVDYVQARQQFGRAIGSNQALRHRVAEMRVALEMVRSAAMAGLLALQVEDDARRERELSRAKMLVARHGTFIAQQAIQLHGGIGMTIEYPVGHCLRRMMVIEQLFGDGATHAARLGGTLSCGV